MLQIEEHRRVDEQLSGSVPIEVLREAFADANKDPLWQALKAKRTELAREQGVPPYVIFHDSTLLEILNRRPGSLREMGEISGVGQAKLAKYGDEFLQVLEETASGAG